MRENLRLGAYLRRDGFDESYERVGYFPWLEEREDQQAGTLSGGEQQMLALAGRSWGGRGCCSSTSRPSAWRRSSSARSSASSAS